MMKISNSEMPNMRGWVRLDWESISVPRTHRYSTHSV